MSKALALITLALKAIAAFFGWREGRAHEELGKRKAEARGNAEIRDIQRRLRDVDADKLRKDD